MGSLTKRKARQIEKIAFEYYRKLDSAHGVDHAIRTMRIAEYLAREEKADSEMCRLGALLHQFHDTGVVEQLLMTISVDRKLIKELTRIVECSSRSNIDKAVSKEEKIVFDADKLQVLGPFGFCRQFSHLLKSGEKDFKEAVKKTAEIQKAIYKNYLQTQAAKKIIEEPQDLMNEFLRLFKHWDKFSPPT